MQTEKIIEVIKKETGHEITAEQATQLVNAMIPQGDGELGDDALETVNGGANLMTSLASIAGLDFLKQFDFAKIWAQITQSLQIANKANVDATMGLVNNLFGADPSKKKSI